jgi:hypothetical protein
MIGQYLPNNNENATVAFCQKIWHPNGAQLCGRNSFSRDLYGGATKQLQL